MRAVAIIVNVFLPGVGTLIVGKVFVGIVQILLYALAHLLIWTAILAIVGIPLAFIVWIWALVSAATAPLPPPTRPA